MTQIISGIKPQLSVVVQTNTECNMPSASWQASEIPGSSIFVFLRWRQTERITICPWNKALFLISWHMLRHRADLISLTVMAFLFIWTALIMWGNCHWCPFVCCVHVSASARTCQCSNCLSERHRRLTDLLLCLRRGKDVSSSQQPAATAAVCSAFDTVIKDVGLEIDTLCLLTVWFSTCFNPSHCSTHLQWAVILSRFRLTITTEYGTQTNRERMWALLWLIKGDRRHFWPLA